jgi:hypothetical protein
VDRVLSKFKRRHSMGRLLIGESKHWASCRSAATARETRGVLVALSPIPNGHRRSGKDRTSRPSFDRLAGPRRVGNPDRREIESVPVLRMVPPVMCVRRTDR